MILGLYEVTKCFLFNIVKKTLPVCLIGIQCVDDRKNLRTQYINKVSLAIFDLAKTRVGSTNGNRRVRQVAGDRLSSGRLSSDRH